MSNRLEQFVQDHREEFDTEEPGKRIWDKIQLPIEPDHKKTIPIIRMNRTWWSAAAAVILLIAGSTWFLIRSHHSTSDQPFVAAGNQPSHTQSPSAGQPSDTGPGKPPVVAQQDNSGTLTTNGAPAGKDLAQNSSPAQKDNASDAGALVNEEMYHYAKLVELKHKELKAIQKDEPLLYKQFAADVSKLDSVYHTLEQQLPTNPNHEQLLEAMLQNLQLQMGLLNHQLDIIKQINHSKKAAYEKAYKTI
jgi:hypothetical protein